MFGGSWKRRVVVARRCGLLALVAVALAVVGAPAAVAAGLFTGGDEPPGLVLPSWHSSYGWSAGDGYAGWTPRVIDADRDAYGLETALGGKPGLWLWPRGGRSYGPGAGEWVLEAPGTTRIASARITFAYEPKVFAHHCLRLGLRVADEQRSAWEACKPPTPASTRDQVEVQLADPSGAPTAKQLYLQLAVPGCEHANAKSCEKWIPEKDPLGEGGYARVTSVDLVLVDDDLPVVRPAGAFFELDGRYIDGRQTYPLRVDVEDAGAGVTGLAVDHTGWPGPQPPLVEHESACDPRHHTDALGARLCPPRDAVALEVDTRPMPEGTRRFRAHSTDVAGNTGERGWTVIIDRTPPTPPADLRFTTPDEGSAQATWNAAEDPALPDGTPGSGVAEYRVRHRVAGSDWSQWAPLTADSRSSVEIFDQPASTEVAFQVQALDAVGNASEVMEVAGEVPGDAPYVVATGELYETDYIGFGRHEVALSASDTGAGVRRMWLEADGAQIAGRDAGCSARYLPDGSPWKSSCPAQSTAVFTLDGGALMEGARFVEALAIDRAANIGTAGGVTVLVDHTAPNPPEQFEALGFDAATQQAELLWDDGLDPDLADGNPGAGVETSAYRVQRGGGAWSDWHTTEDASVVLQDAYLGERVRVQLRSIDGVGNESEAVEADVVVDRDGDQDQTEETPARLAPVQSSPQLATVAVVKSAGARKVAKLNKRAHLALGKAIVRPWGRALRRAEAALDRFRTALNVCSAYGQRPPSRGCPGLTSGDIDVEDAVVPLYERMRAVHDRVVAEAKGILEAIKRALGFGAPSAEEVKRYQDALIEFAIEAAQMGGNRDPKDIEKFAKEHEQDILDGAAMVGRREIHYNGGKYIARGARNRALRNTLKEIYRAPATKGDGSTMDMLHAEVKAGCRLVECKHYTKAIERRTNLQNILSDEPLSTTERELVGELIGRLNKAITAAGGA
jgi:hypothetical protein